MYKKVISIGKFYLYTDSHKVDPYIAYKFEDLQKMARDRVKNHGIGSDPISMYINKSKKELDYKEELNKLYNQKLGEFTDAYIDYGNVYTRDNPSTICKNKNIISVEDNSWNDYFITKISEDKEMLKHTIEEFQEDMYGMFSQYSLKDEFASYEDRAYKELSYLMDTLVKMDDMEANTPEELREYIFETKPIADYLIDSNNRCISLEETSKEEFIRYQKNIILKAKKEDIRIKEFIISIGDE